MKNKKPWIIGGIILIVLVIIGMNGKKKGWFNGGNAKQVAAEKAQSRTILETVTASGKIHSETEVKVSSEVSGEIILLNVKEGDSVKKGDLLLEINPVIYESMVSQSEAGVSQVRANRMAAEATYKSSKVLYDQAVISFNRQKQLHDEKIISDADFDLALNTLKNAETTLATTKEQMNAAMYTVNSSEAQLKQAHDNLVKTRIYAPMTGIVSLCSVKLGERVVGTAQMAGTELIRIADLDHMQAEVDVSENDVLKVKVGDTASVEVDAYLNKKFTGVVSEIAYSSSTSTAIVSTSQAINFSVKVKLVKDSYAQLVDPAHGLKYPFRPGMSATVDIRTNAKANILTVPIQSVTTRENKDSTNHKDNTADTDDNISKDKKKVQEVVFLVDNGKAKAVNVKTGIQDANYIEITSGIKDGDMVIKAPFKLISKTLETGDKIEMVSEKSLFKDDAK
ncbi:MAG: family efflux transporter, subunit [Bacteroidetes bacterium]|nr:family efflux transporter, subunit [Bacteroidota bacterium]